MVLLFLSPVNLAEALEEVPAAVAEVDLEAVVDLEAAAVEAVALEEAEV